MSLTAPADFPVFHRLTVRSVQTAWVTAHTELCQLSFCGWTVPAEYSQGATIHLVRSSSAPCETLQACQQYLDDNSHLMGLLRTGQVTQYAGSPQALCHTPWPPAHCLPCNKKSTLAFISWVLPMNNSTLASGPQNIYQLLQALSINVTKHTR